MVGDAEPLTGEVRRSLDVLSRGSTMTSS